jgi:predicted transcriptional regulator
MPETMGIKIDESTKQRLKALSELRDRSPHWLAKKALEEYLDREEAYEREKREDMERWEEYLTTENAIPHEKVANWLRAMIEQGKYVEWQE